MAMVVLVARRPLRAADAWSSAVSPMPLYNKSSTTTRTPRYSCKQTLILLSQIPGYKKGKQQRCHECDQPASWACARCSTKDNISAAPADGAGLQDQVWLPRRAPPRPGRRRLQAAPPGHHGHVEVVEAASQDRPRAPLRYQVRHLGVGHGGQTRTSTSPSEGAVELAGPCMCRAARLGLVLHWVVVLGKTPTRACVPGTTLVWVRSRTT